MQRRSVERPLAELQRWLVSVSTDPDGALRGVERATSRHFAGHASPAHVETLVTAGPRLSALERLAIYNDGYFARLVECLRDDYPAVAYLLGGDGFEGVARDYVRAHPSRSPSLNAYGAQFPAYLATLTETWAPFGAELARLEWALVEVVHAETHARLEPAALARVAPDEWRRVRFAVNPALRLLDFAYPVSRVYQAFRDEREPELPACANTSTVVHRTGLAVHRLELEPAMRALLGELVAGKTLASALEVLAAACSAAELAAAERDLSEWFSAWVAAGFFVGLPIA